MTYFSYWGKAQSGWHLLPFHSLDVAACAQALLDARPEWTESLSALTQLDPSDLRAWTGFFASIHDLGKFASAFQGLAPDVAEALGRPGPYPAYDVRHDSLGWALWEQTIAPKLFSSRREQRRLAPWVRIVTGHHGQPPSLMKGTKRVRPKNYYADEDVLAAADWVIWTKNHFCPRLDIGSRINFERSSWWLAGLVTLADWLGSNTEWFPYRAEPEPLEQYWARTSVTAKRALKESGLVPASRRNCCFSELFPNYAPTPMQTAVDALRTDAPSLVVIEDLTGSGKTEAALVASGNRFYFGLPTTATANGLWARVSKDSVLEGHKTLIHGSRWLVPNAMTAATSWLNDSTRRALLAQIGVGTIDQALLAVLYARFSTLRLIGLADKALIVDEVHAYDDYQRAVLSTLIEMQARIGGSVILLSATMPAAHRQCYAEAWAHGRGIDPPCLRESSYPLLSQICDKVTIEQSVPARGSRVVQVDWVHTQDAAIQRLVAAVSHRQCACWVRNTVADAIEAYELINALGLDVQLIHARFTRADRATLEKRVQRNFGKSSTEPDRAGRIVVATQVVEQSLDIDFDVLVSDVAPIELLIQRAGRLHRHERGERGKPILIVHAPTWEPNASKDWLSAWNRRLAMVYPDHGRLWLTIRLLRQHQLILPRDARLLLEGVYGEDAIQDAPSELRGISDRQVVAAQYRTSQAGYHAISPGGSYEADGTPRWSEERAPTRLGEPSQEWVIVENGKPLRGTAADSVVTVRSSLIVKAPNDKAIEVAQWQRTLNLNNGSTNGVGRGERPVVITYDSIKGLVVV